MSRLYIPKLVGPSKLDLSLATAPELTLESRTKVRLITSIVHIAKLLGHPKPTPREFYALYDSSIGYLEALEHQSQVDYNTRVYTQQSQIQGADF